MHICSEYTVRHQSDATSTSGNFHLLILGLDSKYPKQLASKLDHILQGSFLSIKFTKLVIIQFIILLLE